MGLQVKLPMNLKGDNSAIKDLIDIWAVGGRTGHGQTKLNWLHKLRGNGDLILNGFLLVKIYNCILDP